MRYRLSGKSILCLQLLALAVLTAMSVRLRGGFWMPPALYLFGATLVWFLSAPGSKRQFASHVRRHGMANWGHATRAAWDRQGRHARFLLQAGCLVFAVVLAYQAGFGSHLFWRTILSAVAFAMGVELGFLAFKTGDESEWRRHRQPVPSSHDE